MAGRCWWKTTGDRLARCIGDGHKKAAMTCKRWGGLGAYHNERHNKLHDSSVLPSLIARENADAVSGQLGRRYRRGLSEWHPDFVLIGSDCIGSFCDLQPRHVHCTRAPFSLDTACGSGFSAGSKPRILCRCVMQTAPVSLLWLLAISGGGSASNLLAVCVWSITARAFHLRANVSVPYPNCSKLPQMG